MQYVLAIAVVFLIICILSTEKDCWFQPDLAISPKNPKTA